MADINLEAEQVVGEEEEESPRKRSGFNLRRKTYIVVGSIVILEAFILFVAFGVMGGSDSPAEAKESAPVDLADRLQAKPVEIGEVSFWDPSNPSPRADRRFTAKFTVILHKDAYAEIEEAMAENESAMDLVKLEIARAIRHFMLATGGEALKDKEMQRKFPDKLRDYLNDELLPLRNHILDVHMEGFRPARY